MEKNKRQVIGAALTVFGITISAVKFKRKFTEKIKLIDNLSQRVTDLEKRALAERQSSLDKWR